LRWSTYKGGRGKGDRERGGEEDKNLFIKGSGKERERMQREGKGRKDKRTRGKREGVGKEEEVCSGNLQLDVF